MKPEISHPGQTVIDVFVVDTNVLLVANQKHPDVSPDCVQTCVNVLERIQARGRVALDDAYLILEEYNHKTSPNQPKGVGDVFLKWLHRNPSKCDWVSLHASTPDQFQEFPSDPALASFDPPDRKFVAVAAAHPGHPPILQAADCKWLDWQPVLARQSISVDMLRQEDVNRFYQKKFGP